MYDLGEFLVDLDLVEFPVYLFGLLAFSGLTTDGMDSRVMFKSEIGSYMFDKHQC
jgi:hypothetical protein